MTANWWGADGIEPPASKGLRLQRSGGPAALRLPKNGSGPANRTRLTRRMRPEGSPDLCPQTGGGRVHSKPMPCGTIGFRDRAGASPVHPPGWRPRQGSNLHPSPSDGGAPPVELRGLFLPHGARAGIEPWSAPYKEAALPLSYTSNEMATCTGLEPVSPRRQRGRLTRSVAGRLADQVGLEPTKLAQRLKRPLPLPLGALVLDL